VRRRMVTKKIGELLIERDIISPKQLEEALSLQKENKKLLGEILINLGYATEEDIMVCLTTQYGMPYLPLESYEVDMEVVKGVPAELVRKYNFVPIDKISNLLTIVVSDILDIKTIDEIKNALHCKVQCFVSTPDSLRRAIEKYYG